MSTKKHLQKPEAGYRKARAQFEAATHEHFKSALDAAWTASWNETKKNGLSKMGAFTAVRIIHGALMRQVARYLPGI